MQTTAPGGSSQALAQSLVRPVGRQDLSLLIVPLKSFRMTPPGPPPPHRSAGTMTPPGPDSVPNSATPAAISIAATIRPSNVTG